MMGHVSKQFRTNNFYENRRFLCSSPGVDHSISVFDDSIVINIMLRRSTLHSMFYNFLNIPNKLSSFFLNNIYAKRANDYILFHSGIDPTLRESFYLDALGKHEQTRIFLSLHYEYSFVSLLSIGEKLFRICTNATF